ncbi:hypothetical protein KCU65_g15, partial [Aureobasidium melanogenum]
LSRDVRKLRRLQYEVYMRNMSPAKMAASPPPAPGLISIRHGRSANGWRGTNAKSSSASSTRSLSVLGSDRSVLSSDRESFAFSHSFNADFVMLFGH